MEYTFHIEQLELANDFEFYILNYCGIDYKRKVSEYFYEFTIEGTISKIDNVIAELEKLKNRKNYYVSITSELIRDVTLEFVREKNRLKKEGWYNMIVCSNNWKQFTKKDFHTFAVRPPKKKYRITDKPDKRGFYHLFDYTKSKQNKIKSVNREKLVLHAKLHLD